MILPSPPLLLITDRRQSLLALAAVVSAALQGGCRWISLREKDLGHDARVDLLGRLVGLGQPFGATIMVHADIDAACAIGARGVHLPSGASPEAARRRLGPTALIGVSAHSQAEIEAAAGEGADYATLSPIFPSESKRDYGPPLGLAALRDAASAFEIPVLALGGVTTENAGGCLAAGAAGIAIMGTIMRAEDPAIAAAQLIDAMQRTSALPASNMN